ncbi:TPA: DotA/TraY family protein [Stenotrophomonas maltophilia]|nr:DotA/TraY family protein [Stenotrophomonas maltophilia]
MNDKPRKARVARPTLKERVEYRDASEAVQEFRETAEAIGRTPADCLREAARDWTAKTKAVYGLAPYLLFLFASLMPGLAFAEGPFSVSDSDLSKKLFLDSLFPELTGAGGTSPLAAAVGVFNSAVLIVAGVLVMYTLIAGTLSTAQDGELLGKKWSSLWVPIRTTLGAAAIMPTFGGFSLIQAIVIWLALQGVGIANAVWGAYADNPLAGAAYVPPSEVRQLQKTAGAMFQMHVCRAALAKEQQRTDMAALGSVGLKDWTASKSSLDSNGSSSGQWGWELKTGWGFSCGNVLISKPYPGDIPAESATAKNLINPYEVAQAIFPAHQAAMAAMDARMSTLADQFVENPYTADGNSINGAMVSAGVRAAAEEYAASIKSASQAYANTLQSDDFKQALTQDGWMMAGAFYTKIAHSMDALASATGRTAKVRLNNSFPETFATTRLLWAEGAAALEEVASPGAATIGAERGGEVMDKLLTIALDVGRDVSPDGMSGHPLIASKNTGEAMKSWGWGILTVGALAVAGVGILAGNVAGKGLGSDIAFLGVMDLISTPIFALVGPLILGGSILANVVPMLPFILWVGVILGWMVLVVEAVIASPLWAVAHLAPDGDGVVGRGGQGYMLVLSLTLRPALMVLGLICAIAIIVPIGELLNSTFANVFRMSVMQDNASWGGLTTVVVGVCLYAVLMVTIITKVFGLIHVIPDNVLRWIGGGVDNMLGQNAQPLAGAAEGQSTALLGAGVAAGAMTNQLGNKLAGAAKEHAARQAREDEHNERQDDAALEGLERSREKAWNAEEKAEGSTSASSQDRAADAQTRHGQAAVNVASRMDEGFGERLAEARQADQGTGGTAAQDALIASEASNGPDAQPYQRALAEAQDAFGKAQQHAQASQTLARNGALTGQGGGAGMSMADKAAAQAQALDSGAGDHYSSRQQAVDAAAAADPSFAQGLDEARAAGNEQAFVSEKAQWAGVREDAMRKRLAEGDQNVKPLRASDAILRRAAQDGVL